MASGLLGRDCTWFGTPYVYGACIDWLLIIDVLLLNEAACQCLAHAHGGYGGLCFCVCLLPFPDEPGACVRGSDFQGRSSTWKVVGLWVTERSCPGLWFVVLAHFCTARKVAPLQSLNLQVYFTTIASACWDWLGGRQHKDTRILISAYTCARCFTFSYLHVC